MCGKGPIKRGGRGPIKRGKRSQKRAAKNRWGKGEKGGAKEGAKRVRGESTGVQTKETYYVIFEQDGIC